ncbi:MAG: DUF3768 domain-containing protein [Alphaproteobacteria bacterium]|nr:DUF3768 domain-containing protein [Alphaproteobacteria bacterium]
MENSQFQSIAEQNDDFRLHPSKGTFCLTSGIRALGKDSVREIIDIVRNFNNFNEDNDPYGEHDFGVFYYRNRQIFFKIDNYDREFLYLSPDVTNPKLTNKVLTVMLAQEY